MARERILIVEDERDLAQLMDKVMTQNGYETSLAYDGVTGLSLALEEQPDLIILDLRLPKMHGMQILHRLREHQRSVPVVIVTAGSSEELAIEALRLGVRDYIRKPFALQELLDAVERALSEERLRRERAMLTEQVLVSNQELERRVGQLTALHEVGQALVSTLDLDELLDVVLREASQVLKVNVTSIFLLDKETGELVFRSGTGADASIPGSLRLATGQGIAGWVAQHGEPLLVHDAQSDPRFSPAFDEMMGFVTRSILCVPLMVKGRVIGVVEALNKPQPGFTEDDIAILRLLAASAAVCIDNTQLFEETHRLHR
jgi:DNA-binding response OmpR family regulator